MPKAQTSPPSSSATLPTAPQYVPPRIESVMKPEDLAREVQYAGAQDTTGAVGWSPGEDPLPGDSMQETRISPPPKATTSSTAAQYTPPRIESIMKPEDLAREVQYAGAQDQTFTGWSIVGLTFVQK